MNRRRSDIRYRWERRHRPERRAEAVRLVLALERALAERLAVLGWVRCCPVAVRLVAIVAVARKLLCIMRAMQLTGEMFNAKLVEDTLQAA